MTQKNVLSVISQLNLEDDIRDYVSNLVLDAIETHTLTSSQQLEDIIGQHLLMHEVVSAEEELPAKCKTIFDSLVKANALKLKGESPSSHSTSPSSSSSSSSSSSQESGFKKLSRPICISNETEEKQKEKETKKHPESDVRESTLSKEKLKAKRKESGAEKKKKSGSAKGGEELDNDSVTPRWEKKYFLSGVWKLELAVKDVKEWTPEELKTFIVSLGRKGSKWETLFVKVANVVEASEITGALLLAGGAEQLVEKCLNIAHKDRSILKRNANQIFKALAEKQSEKDRILLSAKDNPSLPNHKITPSKSMKEEKKKQKIDNYWRILMEGTEKEKELIEEFKNSSMRSELKQVLSLLPRHQIRYCLIVAPKFDVRYVNKMVSKDGDQKNESKEDVEEDEEAEERAGEVVKVVSVATLDSPEVIERNFIYAKTKAGRWRLITSVDFEQHGVAPPGHWHLNRAPDGDLMEHWGVSLTNIFHGNAKKCPLWWFLIPTGKRYNKTPDRELLKEDED